MRHRVQRSRLSLSLSARKALLRSLSRSMIINGAIVTTKERAKNARALVEKLITLGKKGDLSSRRRAYSVLSDHDLISKLFNEIAPKFKSRSGGYTRIVRLGNRRGDDAEMVLFELTEKIKEEKPKAAQKEKAKSRPGAAGVEKPAVTKETGAHGHKPEKERLEEKITKEEKSREEKKLLETPPPEKKKPPKFMGGLRSFFKRKAP